MSEYKSIFERYSWFSLGLFVLYLWIAFGITAELDVEKKNMIFYDKKPRLNYLRL